MRAKISAELVALRQVAADWREAVTLAGDLLSNAGCTRAKYTAEMIRIVEQYGPYSVIAPGLALAHAQPGSDVKQDSLAVVTLATPVEFGHAHNDPVRVVLAVAMTHPDAHVSIIADLARVLDRPGAVDAIADATDEDTVLGLLAADGITVGKTNA